MDKRLERQIGARIQLLRRARTGLSQEKFSVAAGIDYSYLAGVEQGRHRLSVSMLKRIADGLDLSMSEILKGL
ncbi:helix-turn-helix domain protein [Coriobacterium glomerans PW2]|uniref:Helix-turn-helix domain protein n=1 Tax=Coriobacterium glomerans (strain ATCC 49209 / DSM 20642 / JCM 10262 / PW2) TaxID=700015 RepID=F2N708_CORGP|nr:helix-turn-helix transcriptional regulator [Coriobacterium glomerans]AEB06347.1 helix-turn-helix domain protein [Coriobacterium glomerans PW2]